MEDGENSVSKDRKGVESIGFSFPHFGKGLYESLESKLLSFHIIDPKIIYKRLSFLLQNSTKKGDLPYIHKRISRVM